MSRSYEKQLSRVSRVLHGTGRVEDLHLLLLALFVAKEQIGVRTL